MKMKLIYLASPHTAKTKALMAWRKKQVTLAAAALTEKYGYAMFLPITQSSQMQKHRPALGGTFANWERINLYVVGKKAAELWVLTIPGWKEFIGVTQEIICAFANSVPVYTITPETLKKERLKELVL